MSISASELFHEMQVLLDTRTPCGDTRIILIDGRAGSGKTSLASDLSLHFAKSRRVEIIHLDEIYAGWKEALSPTLTQNLSKVLKSLQMKDVVKLNVYNWHTAEFDTSRTFAPPDILIIEGVGSGQKCTRDMAALIIWMDISQDSGLQRVLERDGNEISEEMSNWQILEDDHFKLEKSRDFADYVLSSGA